MDFSDLVVRYGDFLLKLAIAAGSVFAFISYIRTEITSLRSDVTQIKEHQKLLMESIKQLNTVLTQIAVQDARLNMIEKDIDELRHRRGFVDD